MWLVQVEVEKLFTLSILFRFNPFSVIGNALNHVGPIGTLFACDRLIGAVLAPIVTQ